MERRYTLAEVDLMREAVKRRFPGRTLRWEQPIGGAGDFTPDSVRELQLHEQLIAARLQTYLLAGVEPKDLE